LFGTWLLELGNSVRSTALPAPSMPTLCAEAPIANYQLSNKSQNPKFKKLKIGT